MSRFGTHYQVGRPTGVCAETGNPLEPGSVCVATLWERSEDEGFDRRDYSVEAWEQMNAPQGLFSSWRTTVPEPDARPRLLIDDDVLMDLFERLADDDRPKRQAFRFVITLILMRKRQLKFCGRQPASDGDQELWLVRPRGNPPETPALEVVDPKLSDDDVRELTDQLSEILRSEL